MADFKVPNVTSPNTELGEKLPALGSHVPVGNRQGHNQERFYMLRNRDFCPVGDKEALKGFRLLFLFLALLY